MWALGLFKLLQNVRLLYRNSGGGGGFSVAVGVRFVLARVVEVGLAYIPKRLLFSLSFMVPVLMLHFIPAMN